jgi:hypothetical protein
MVEIDMNREPESNLLLGTNLWQVAACKQERSKSSNEPMLRIKFKCGANELNDVAMLGGKGWGIGKAKLIALGLSPTFSGNLEPLDFVGRNVWIATVLGSFEGVDKKTGNRKTFQKLEVDIGQLEHAGYQAADKVPAGAVKPGAGLGVDPDSDLPF